MSWPRRQLRRLVQRLQGGRDQCSLVASGSATPCCCRAPTGRSSPAWAGCCAPAAPGSPRSTSTPATACSIAGADEGVIRWRRPMSEWPAFVRELIRRQGIDAVYLFGDCRPMHRDAVAACRALDVPVYVFEEGYLRPDYITCERGGVNGNSSLPRDPEFYRRAAASLPEPPAMRAVGPPSRPSRCGPSSTPGGHLLRLALPALPPPPRRQRRAPGPLLGARLLSQAVVPHPRGLGPRPPGRRVDRPLLLRAAAGPLRRPGHPLALPLGVEAFIEEVVAAFAAHAPADTLLCLKHHPHDRPYRDYTRLLRASAAATASATASSTSTTCTCPRSCATPAAPSP
jgi:hypothetical protein